MRLLANELRETDKITGDAHTHILLLLTPCQGLKN